MTYDDRETRRRVSRMLDRVRKLHVSRRDRDAHGVFFVEGVRNFVAAVDNDLEIEKVLYSDRLLTSGLARKLVRGQRRAGVPTVSLTPEEFRSFSRAEHASGVSAIIRQRLWSLDSVRPRSGACSVG